jgi:hypothetical protein
MSVAFFPYRQPREYFCKLGQVSFDDVEWPLNDRPDGQRLCDLGPRDHVLMISSSRMLTIRTGELRAPVSMLLMEPPAIQGRFYIALRVIATRYHRVLTHSTNLLRRLPNAQYVPLGGSMLETPDQPIIEKTKRISLIASSKRTTVGQKLRHRIVQWAADSGSDLEALGYGYKPLQDKADGHAPYRFSVVIENCREPGFFTEKLIDSFLCRSLPIYWGAPDIEHFFDPRGMILCRTADDIRRAIEKATPADYERRVEFLKKNRQTSLRYIDCVDTAARCLEDSNNELGATTPTMSELRRSDAA